MSPGGTNITKLEVNGKWKVETINLEKFLGRFAVKEERRENSNQRDKSREDYL